MPTTLLLKVESFDGVETSKSTGPITPGSPSRYKVTLTDKNNQKYFLYYSVSSMPPQYDQSHTLSQIRQSDLSIGKWYQITGLVNPDGTIVIETDGSITAQ